MLLHNITLQKYTKFVCTFSCESSYEHSDTSVFPDILFHCSCVNNHNERAGFHGRCVVNVKEIAGFVCGCAILKSHQ